jgi:hypothetical protein
MKISCILQNLQTIAIILPFFFAPEDFFFWCFCCATGLLSGSAIGCSLAFGSEHENMTRHATISNDYNDIQRLQRHATTCNDMQRHSTTTTTCNDIQRHATTFNDYNDMQRHSTTTTTPLAKDIIQKLTFCFCSRTFLFFFFRFCNFFIGFSVISVFATLPLQS